MKRSVIVLCIFLMCLPLSANDDIKHHGLSIHVGGTLSLYEIGYQFNFLSKNDHLFSVNINVNSAIISLGIPMGLDYSYGKNNRLLLGVRVMPMWSYDLFPEEDRTTPSPIMYSLKLGYGRLMHPWGQDYLLSFYASPVYDPDNRRVIPWGGIGLTTTFNL